MTFLQPMLLWGLPAVSLPILIHFLNRLRFRSVRWAAIMFLISATRSSTRRARLRHYLLLLFRTLIILFLVLALSRPLVGGWVGSAFSGAPETVLILLDRSASMETIDPRLQISKRAHALNLFRRAADTAYAASRFVLIENVLRTPQEITAVSALDTLTLTAPTDTAADLPAMLRAALQVLVANKTGRTEIWIASDLQSGNWRPESSDWPDVTARLAALPQSVTVRLLALPGAGEKNRSLSLADSERRRPGSRSCLAVAFDIAGSQGSGDAFPLILTFNGTRLQSDVKLESRSLRFRKTLDIAPAQELDGWGKAEIPSDENVRDNICYFVYGSEGPLRSAIVSDQADAARILKLACAPGSATNRSCDIVPLPSASSPDWNSLSLLIWQKTAATNDIAQALQTFVENGGTVVCFPTGTPDSRAPFGIEWKATDAADKLKPFRVTTWEENDGLLAKTDNGMNLPIAKLSVLRRQSFDLPVQAPPSGTNISASASSSEWFPLAAFADGKPFLARRYFGRGSVFVCASLPLAAWSNLGDGTVLVPMIQRALKLGARRFSSADIRTCGDFAPAEQDTWTVLDSKDFKDPRSHAGVYQCGSKRLALNRPPREDDPDTADTDRIRQIFGDLKVHITEELTAQSSDRMQSEIWPLLLCLALLSMVAESLVMLSGNKSAREVSTPEVPAP